VAELAAQIDGAEAALRRAVPEVGLIYIEPDMRRPTAPGPATDVTTA
jgi:hypothetical protein